jgi:hypothetical protein
MWYVMAEPKEPETVVTVSYEGPEPRVQAGWAPLQMG